MSAGVFALIDKGLYDKRWSIYVLYALVNGTFLILYYMSQYESIEVIYQWLSKYYSVVYSSFQ